MIRFHFEDTKFTLRNRALLREWFLRVAKREKKVIGELNYIFCSDDFLYEMNVRYLNHHTLTDIITFDNSEQNTGLGGDIFISIDRVRENAKAFGVPVTNELHRVMVHGLLHLCGYKDKSAAQAKTMRQKENDSLTLLSRLIKHS